MHRALCRGIRGACRIWRENEVPIVAAEEVGKNKENKEKFVPPGYTFNEALGFGGFLMITYEVIHRRRHLFPRKTSPDFDLDVSKSPVEIPPASHTKKCPLSLFSLIDKALNQPISTASYVNSSKVESSSSRQHAITGRSTVVKRSSIDTSPFLPESFLSFSSDSPSDIEEDDSSGIFFEDNSKPSDKTSPVQTFAEVTKPSDPAITSLGQRLAGDILSAYGAFKFLVMGNKSPDTTTSSPSSSTSEPPQLTAMELLEKGAELGSCRALYNIGVAYDRLGDEELAKEYYSRAASGGHILAAYNLAVFYLRDVTQFDEGMSLMRYAEQNGVPEARDFFNDLKDVKP